MLNINVHYVKIMTYAKIVLKIEEKFNIINNIMIILLNQMQLLKIHKLKIENNNF
jgi:hypothetical protein